MNWVLATLNKFSGKFKQTLAEVNVKKQFQSFD